MIEPPKVGDNTDELWRTVAELTKVVNVLSTMTVIVSDKNIEKGRLEINEAQAVLILE